MRKSIHTRANDAMLDTTPSTVEAWQAAIVSTGGIQLHGTH